MPAFKFFYAYAFKHYLINILLEYLEIIFIYHETGYFFINERYC